VEDIDGEILTNVVRGETIMTLRLRAKFVKTIFLSVEYRGFPILGLLFSFS